MTLPVRNQKERLDRLRKLLEEGEPSTQEELRARLEQEDFEVTQSTISRDLRKLGAVRATDASNRAVYRLPDAFEPPLSTGGLSDLVKEIQTNGSMIVMRTVVGSAPLIARHLDNVSPDGVLGTIAGDDTIFIAPAATGPREIRGVIRAITDCLTPALPKGESGRP